MPLTQVQGGMLQGSTNTTTTIQSNGTTAITIDSSQNVGIGVTSPTGKLAIDATNSNTPRIVFKNPSANGDAAISTFGSSTGTDVILGSNAYINSAGNFARFDSAQAGSYVYANRSGLLLFGTNDTSGVATERMRIASNGVVTIQSSGTNLYLSTVFGSESFSIDAGATRLTLANGAFADVSASGSFSGYVMMNECTVTGQLAMYVAGSGTVNIFGQVGGAFTNSASSGSYRFYHTGGGVFRLLNSSGSTATFGIITFRTRNSG